MKCSADLPLGCQLVTPRKGYTHHGIYAGGGPGGGTGTLYRTTGPSFGPTFNQAMVQVIITGTVSLAFTDASNGTLTYTVNGVSGSKAITRQLF